MHQMYEQIHDEYIWLGGKTSMIIPANDII